MKAAVYSKKYKKDSKKYIKTLLDTLNKNNFEVSIEESFYNDLKRFHIIKSTYNTFNHFNDLDSSFDFMFTIGGDGTILRAITYVRNIDIPIIGINTGRLGFLATVQKENIKTSIDLLLKKQYSIRERTLLKVSSKPDEDDFDDLNFALNEVSFSRKNTTSMITVDTYLNDEYLTSYWADGLIIATPTGSTGYSLSCEGPVITPLSKNFVLTPIAPHNLNNRPVIIPDNTKIKICVSGREKQFLLSLDSRVSTIKNKSVLYLEKANFSIKLVQLSNQTFIKTLREKLLWGHDTRN